tara:strand:- start:434 stop:970 length:537 start_codon:yes stop_codon:yes gene_type:complete
MSQCVICLNDINNEFTTKCNHSFCNTCITNWLLTHNNCPTCRFDLVQNTPQQEQNDDDDDDDEEFESVHIEELLIEGTRSTEWNFINQFSDEINEELDNFIEDVQDGEIEITHNCYINTYIIESKNKTLYAYMNINKNINNARITYESVYHTPIIKHKKNKLFKHTNKLKNFNKKIRY